MTVSTASAVKIRYSPILEAAIEELSAAILASQTPGLQDSRKVRWVAIKLLEHDTTISAEFQADPLKKPLFELSRRLTDHLADQSGEDSDVLIADERYSYINQLTRAVVQKNANGPTISEQIDRVVTNRWLGIPIFLLVMYTLFRMTSEIPAAMVDWLDFVLNGPLARWVTAVLTWMGLGGTWVQHLVVNGILAGVGGVLVFVPVLTALYLGLGVLEDSGYMARAAFVVDRLMHTLGLHGKSFLPMIVGFGCTVPGIYATRVMENPRERILTGLLVPFMSCSARLPVYLLFAAVFFPQQAGMVVFGLYLGGIVMAILVGQLLNRTIFRGMPQSALIMEMPSYHRPILKNILRQTWERTSDFINKAGTTILFCSMLIWLLMAVPAPALGQASGERRFAEIQVEESLFGALAQVAAPVFSPLGFGSWQATGALVTGVVAKEVVVSTLAQAYAGGDRAQQTSASISAPAPSFGQDLQAIGVNFGQAALDTLRSIPLLVGIDLRTAGSIEVDTRLATNIYSGFAASGGGNAGLAALSFLVFVLLYTPCVSALAVSRHELGTRWMLWMAAGQFAIAWLAGLVVFQAGLLLVGGR